MSQRHANRPPNSTDLYQQTRKRVQDESPPPLPPPVAKPGSIPTPFKELQRRRRQNLFFLLLILVFIAGIVWYVKTVLRPLPLDEVDTTRGPGTPPATGASAIQIKSGSLLDGFSSAPLVFLVDEQKDRPSDVGAVPPGGAPLEANWMRLAGYHLMLAEQEKNRGRVDRALHHYSEAAKVYPEMKGVNAYIGLLHLQAQDYPKAIDALGKAAAEAPLDHTILNNLGVALMAIGQHASAERFFSECLTLAPEYAMGLYNLGSLYFEQQNHSKAIPILNRYLRVKPDNVEAAQMLSRSLIETRDWAQAAAVLEHVVELQPDIPVVLFRLAQCQGMLGKVSDGMDLVERACRLISREQALVWLSRNDLNSLRTHPRFERLLQTLNAK